VPQVNAWLAITEAKYGHSTSGDPSAPKIQWPGPAACRACRAAASESGGAAAWDEAAVREFLRASYGGPAPDAGASSGGGGAREGGRQQRGGGSPAKTGAWLALAAVGVMALSMGHRRGRRHGPNKVL
jgi:hypothetical protein